MDFGFHFAKWDGKPRENKIATPIKQEQVKKPDAYKSINSNSLVKKGEYPSTKVVSAMDLIYSA